MSNWKDQYDNLPEEQQALVQDHAVRSEKPLLLAYFDALERGWLASKEQKEFSRRLNEWVQSKRPLREFIENEVKNDRP